LVALELSEEEELAQNCKPIEIEKLKLSIVPRVKWQKIANIKRLKH
jgi:hypothetical protein